jgi:hypothetical protein
MMISENEAIMQMKGSLFSHPLSLSETLRINLRLDTSEVMNDFPVTDRRMRD